MVSKDKDQTSVRLWSWPEECKLCDSCKLVFGLDPDISTKVLGQDGSALRPTGYHTKDVCPYMEVEQPICLAEPPSQTC